MTRDRPDFLRMTLPDTFALPGEIGFAETPPQGVRRTAT